jgi:hypothetical protein
VGAQQPRGAMGGHGGGGGGRGAWGGARAGGGGFGVGGGYLLPSHLTLLKALLDRDPARRSLTFEAGVLLSPFCFIFFISDTWLGIQGGLCD